MDAGGARDRPRLPSGLRWAAILFGLGFPSLLTWVYFIALNEHAPGLQQAAYAIGKAIQFVFPAFWVFIVERRRLARPSPTGRGLATGIVLGIAISAAMLGAYFGGLAHSKVLETAAAVVKERLASFGVTNRGVMIAAGAFYAIVHSLLEEYYWRWFAFGELRRLVSLRTAIIVSSLAFMGHHVIVLVKYLPELPWWPLASLAVAIGGALWAWLYDRSRSLVAPWISHAVVDAALFAIGYAMAFG